MVAGRKILLNPNLFKVYLFIPFETVLCADLILTNVIQFIEQLGAVAFAQTAGSVASGRFVIES